MRTGSGGRHPAGNRRTGVRATAPRRAAMRITGHLLKDRVAQVEEFLDSLERIHAGGAVFDPEAVRQLAILSAHGDPLSRLTPRERTVLEALAQGHTDAAIAQKPHISLSAVEKNLNAVFDKPGPGHTTGYNRRSLAVLRYLDA
ncbi:DNA-binding response regulator [Streptomyces sp. or43]|nr:DNA-binding response regulator [Streptomyces sp. or43]